MLKLLSQPAQVCFATTFVAPARISTPLAWRVGAATLMSVHFGQAMATTFAVGAVFEAAVALSAWRTLGEAAMPSSPTALYCVSAAMARVANAAVANVRPATANIFGRRIVFISLFFLFVLFSSVHRVSLVTSLIRCNPPFSLKHFLRKSHRFLHSQRELNHRQE